jgi:superfamily II DNA or RNA helicase
MPDRWKNFSLWPHQSTAVEHIESYLEAYESNESSGSALVGMPTGSGKTGIMAVVSRALYTGRSTLILVPSAALRCQVHEEVDSEFWETIGDEPQDGDRSVKTFTPSNAEDVFDETDDEAVYVCTIQTLSTLWREETEYPFGQFKDRIDQVIFDEGHREPAHKWSRAVRSLEKPTILFTATPYRNDFSYFDVDREHTYVYSYHKAVDDGYLREVDFKEEDFQREDDGSYSSFAKYAIECYEDEVADLGSDDDEDPKMIIRCSSKSAIKGVTDALLEKGADALAIHSKFSSEADESFVENVPSEKDEDVQATFLVHQYKLVEGVDIPSIRSLIFYDGFKNARSVVQQVGRIIRNPGQNPGERAIVRAHTTDGQKRYWKGYLEYENQHQDGENEQSIAINTKELFDRLLANQGEVQYIDREYRSAFEFDDEALHEVFRYPRSVNVFTSAAKSADFLTEQVIDEWEDKGYTFTDNVAKPDDNTRVVPYIIQGNSPVLRKRFFLEVRLGFFFLRKGDHHLFFYDSEGGTPSYFREEIEIEDRNQLEKLFHGEGARAQSVSLYNSDVGRDAIRRRTLHAFSIERTAPSLSDHAHFCSMIQGRATGEDESLTRRYLGLARGRVSDRGGKEQTYENYISWLDHVSKTIRDENVQPADVLDRYARPADEPDDATPTYIVLDLVDILDEEVYRYSDDQHLDVAEVGYEVEEVSDSEEEEGSFTLTANEEDYEIRVRYNRSTGRYKLTCEALDNAYTLKDEFSDRYKRGLISHLSREQAFRIVPAADWKIYSRGEFYKPRGLYGEGTEDGIELMGLMTPVDRLRGVESEKGEGGDHAPDQWDPDSLFGVFDQTAQEPDNFEDCNLASHLQGSSILVCDDMRYESADFIAVSEEHERIAFAHIKAGMGKSSASNWQEVCGQASKNLEYMSPYSSSPPPTLDDWEKPWPDQKTKNNNGYYVDNRVRLPTEYESAKNLWRRIARLLKKPNFSREVWLIVGGKFSLAMFRENLKKDSPPPQAVNLVYLLQSTWSSVQQVGANMRIFCPSEED